MVCGQDKSGTVGRDLHSAESSGHAGVSEQCWRRELGQRGLRFATPPALCGHEPAADFCEADSSRRTCGCADECSESDRLHGEFARQTGAPYAMFRTPLLSPSGLPCNAPPWGTVAAVDLFDGKKVWDIPLGSLIPG